MKAKTAETIIRRTEITIETISVTRIRRAFAAQPTSPPHTERRQLLDTFRPAEPETKEEER